MDDDVREARDRLGASPGDEASERHVAGRRRSREPSHEELRLFDVSHEDRRAFAAEDDLQVHPIVSGNVYRRRRSLAVVELPVALALVDGVVLEGVSEPRLMRSQVDLLVLPVGLHAKLHVEERALPAGRDVELDGSVLQKDVPAIGVARPQPEGVLALVGGDRRSLSCDLPPLIEIQGLCGGRRGSE